MFDRPVRPQAGACGRRVTHHPQRDDRPHRDARSAGVAALRLYPELLFPFDGDTLQIVAQGWWRLDDGGFVHRFYTDDDVMFQAVSSDVAGQDGDGRHPVRAVAAHWLLLHPPIPDRPPSARPGSERLRRGPSPMRACPASIAASGFGEEAPGRSR